MDRSLQFELLIQSFKPLKLLDCHGESIDCQSTSDGKSFKIRFDYWEERDIRNISHRKIMRDGAKLFAQVKIENQKLDWNVTAKVRLHNQYLIWIACQVSYVDGMFSVKVGSTVNMRHQAGGGDVKVKVFLLYLNSVLIASGDFNSCQCLIVRHVRRSGMRSWTGTSARGSVPWRM